jgi:hypothetical protein
MSRYCAEDTQTHTVTMFDTKTEANQFALSMTTKFGVQYQVYPEEPATETQMCEVCGERKAEKGDFICMECISRMLVDMDSDETDRY